MFAVLLVLVFKLWTADSHLHIKWIKRHAHDCQHTVGMLRGPESSAVLVTLSLTTKVLSWPLAVLHQSEEPASPKLSPTVTLRDNPQPSTSCPVMMRSCGGFTVCMPARPQGSVSCQLSPSRFFPSLLLLLDLFLCRSCGGDRAGSSILLPDSLCCLEYLLHLQEVTTVILYVLVLPSWHCSWMRSVRVLSLTHLQSWLLLRRPQNFLP